MNAVIALIDLDVGEGAVTNLPRQRLAKRIRRMKVAHGHHVGERLAFRHGLRQKIRALSSGGDARWRHVRQRALEIALVGPPEFVRVVVDDPIGAEVRSHARHLGDPAILGVIVTGLMNISQHALLLELAQDRRRSIDR